MDDFERKEKQFGSKGNFWEMSKHSMHFFISRKKITFFSGEGVDPLFLSCSLRRRMILSSRNIGTPELLKHNG